MSGKKLYRRIDPFAKVTAGELVSRFAFWLCFIAICAIPALVIASSMNLRSFYGPMIAIVFVAAAYTLISSTKGMAHLMKFRAFQRAVQISLILRVTVSVAFPVGMILDVIAGLGASGITPIPRYLAGQGFGSILRISFAVAACVQLVLLVIFAFVFILSWMTYGSANIVEEEVGRAFEVLPVSSTHPRAVLQANPPE